mmetsp:Transcript_36146/g.55506  ORF Transcript_36146/g.55506 Transcript_36146/m.55506 type:complete len:208 (+) Transcript_36146:485-1108(+)
MELYFFYYHFGEGLHFYSKAFGDISYSGNELVVGYEKTPLYAEHPVVPYRIRSMLGRDTKFIMTIRDPFFAFVSLYFHRREKQKIEKSFAEWTWERIHSYQRYATCASKTFADLWIPQDMSVNNYEEYLNIDGFYDVVPNWEAASMIDFAMFEACGKLFINDSILHYDYGKMSRRWQFVLGPLFRVCLYRHRSVIIRQGDVIIDTFV